MFSMSFMVRWSRKAWYRMCFSSSSVILCMSNCGRQPSYPGARGSKESRQCHNPQLVFYQPHFNTPVWAVALWGCCTLTVNAGNRCCPCQLPWHGWSSRENQPCARSGFPGWRGSNPVHPNKEKTLRDSPGSSHTCHEPQPCFCPSFTSLTPQLCLGGRNKKRTLPSELTSGL